MAPPSDTKTASTPATQRPSLLASNRAAQGTNPARSSEPSDFGVSILSAMADTPLARSKRMAAAPAAPRRTGLWFVGTALVAAALLAAAHWQRSQASAEQTNAPVRVAQAPVNTPPRISPQAAPAATAAPIAPSLPLSAATVAAATVAAFPAPAPASAPPTAARTEDAGAALAALGMTTADTPPERKAAPPRTSTPRPTTAAAPKPTAPKVAAVKTPVGRDADAELLAALMAHSDANKDASKSSIGTPAPLTEAERRRFTAKLRDCRAQGSASAQANCRQSACQAANYWGRTKSCPSSGASGLPPLTAAS